MYPILRAVVVAALLALAPAVFCQTPTLRTEDLPMQTVSVADSQADVALRDLVRNPDLYIDGPHVLEGVSASTMSIGSTPQMSSSMTVEPQSRARRSS